MIIKDYKPQENSCIPMYIDDFRRRNESMAGSLLNARRPDFFEINSKFVTTSEFETYVKYTEMPLIYSIKNNEFELKKYPYEYLGPFGIYKGNISFFHNNLEYVKYTDKCWKCRFPRCESCFFSGHALGQTNRVLLNSPQPYLFTQSFPQYQRTN